jgi:large subunit ribosomal protein L29
VKSSPGGATEEFGDHVGFVAPTGPDRSQQLPSVYALTHNPQPFMTKPAQLREMSTEQLTFQMQEEERRLFQLRFQSATEKLDAPSNLRKFRREIARIKTILRERELSGQTP